MDRTNCASAFPIRCSVIWRSPKARAKSSAIRPVARERVDDLLQVLSHLDPALDRQQHHLLEVAGPFVPEESRTLVIANVDQRHRAAIRQSAVKSLAEGLRVGKRVRLHVTRRARCRVIGRQARVIEEHASQRGAIVAQRVVRRSVVVVPPRLREMRGQFDVRVAIGRGGKIESALGRPPRRRQRGCAQDEHQDQEGAKENTSHSGLHGVVTES